MFKYTSIVLSAALLLLGSPLWAQMDLGSNMLRRSWQGYQTNPAQFPLENGVLVSLPSLYSNTLVENITYNDLFGTNADGENVLTIDPALDKLAPDNLIRQNIDIETFGLGVALGPVALTFGHRLRFNGFLQYPRELPELIWNGNAQFIGQTINISPDLDLFNYHEFALGLSYQLSEAFSFGVRAKYLSGVGTITTERTRLELTTDEEFYELSLDSDFLLHTSNSLRYNGFEDISADINFGNFNADRFLSSNNGLAFDIGVALNLGPLALQASVLDLGGTINWEEDVTNYALTGTQAYQGLDLVDQILEDTASFAAIIDTLEAIYQPDSTARAFSSNIGTSAFVGGDLSITRLLTVGAVVFFEEYRDDFRTAAALRASIQATPMLRLGGFYGLRNNRFDNLGLNAELKLGPVLLLAATDNVLTAFRPKDSHQANVRLGFNLLFGNLK